MAQSEMKRLKFSENLISKILSGEKTSTWRINDEKNSHWTFRKSSGIFPSMAQSTGHVAVAN
jgi:hypothetical protein